MPKNFLHERKDFKDLVRIVAQEKGINNPALVEKDYWIMHALYGLKEQKFEFELKGGTSLSKGYQLIKRFSEDIDIHIKPKPEFGINENPKNSNPTNVTKRKDFYDWLANEINIPGIISVVRDHEFDNTDSYTSGGIRLHYKSFFDKVPGLKDGILLEAGFDITAPNNSLLISCWAYDAALEKEKEIEIIDNRAQGIPCYHPGYTFVEKLQTIVTKYRVQKEKGDKSNNFMRQYYDVSCLLKSPEVINFIGTEDYQVHKERRFSRKDLEVPIMENEAFSLPTLEIKTDFINRYKETANLYYLGQPDFEEVLGSISQHLEKL